MMVGSESGLLSRRRISLSFKKCAPNAAFIFYSLFCALVAYCSTFKMYATHTLLYQIVLELDLPDNLTILL